MDGIVLTPPPAPDRRRTDRRAPAVDEALSRVRLRIGPELAVVNIGDAGVLVQGPRLVPGARVDVHIVTPKGRVLVRSTVVRAHVSALQADQVCYRAGLLFDQSVETGPQAHG